MSKYDKEREAMGIQPLSSSSSKEKSKYDAERMSYKKADENKQYADLMKSAHQSNPSSFHLPDIQPEIPEEKGGWNGLFDNPIVHKVVDTAKAIDRGVQSFQDAGSNALTFGLHNKLLEHQDEQQRLENEHSIAGKVGEVTGDLVGVGKLYKGGAALTRKLLPNANKITKLIAPGLAAGVGYQGLKESTDAALDTRNDGNQSLGKRALNVGESAAMFAGGDVALKYAGQGIKALADKTGLSSKLKSALESFFNRGKSETAATSSQTLALPPASAESLAAHAKRNGNILPTNERPIYGRGDIQKPAVVEPLGLPEGNYTKPKRLKVAGIDESFNAVIPKIFTQATERMTPPLENEKLLAKWVQGHLNDAGHDVSLNEVRGLNYEDLRQLAEEMRPRINTADLVQRTAHDMGYGDIYELIPTNIKERMAADAQSRVYGVPAPAVNIKKPDFNVLHVSDAAMPETKVKNIRVYPPSAKSRQTTHPNEIRTDGLTIMQKYFPDGKVDTAILNKLPYEERLQFQKEQAHGNSDSGFNPNSQALENLSSTPPVQSKYATEREQILNTEPNMPNDSSGSSAQADDVVQTAEPRISDKVSGYLEDEIAAANERIKAKRYVSSPDPAVKNADHALIGVTYIEKGTRKLADFTEQMVRQFGEEIRPQVKEIFKQSKQIFKDTEDRVQKDLQGLEGIVPAFLKDLSGFRYNSSDIYRNLKDLFKDKFPQIKKAILDPLDAAKLDNVKMQEEWLNNVHDNVIEKLGIGKGSKLSALTQRFGEKRIDLSQLQQAAPEDWEKVVAADKFFRNAYDTLIDQVNATRKKIYPNNPDKLVPKREDYYRHFQEFSSLTGLKNIFDTPAGIDPHLVGLSEKTLPKTKFAGFMQKRNGEAKFKEDAVGGFLEYLPGASYATHIDPQISVFKNLAKNLASETEKSKNLDNAILFLKQYSQDLAGKTNNFDRIFQENIPGGRKAFKVINWVNGRVKSNTVLGNAGSAISQIANVPTGVAFAKQYAIKGAGMTLLTALKGNPLHEESQFLKERFFGKNYRKFDTRWLDVTNPLKLKNAAIWVMETSDRMGTEFIWNSVYEKGLKEGIKNPIKYADDETRRLVAGRGIGEVPLLQKSKVFQTIAPFTLEVANLWRVQKDFIKAKDFGGLALLMLGSYAFNKLAEEVKGSGVVFDPIQAIKEAAADGLTPLERGGRLAGEVISNIPLGGTLASIYPEYGGDVLGAKLPTRKDVFGDNDPTRFGPSLIAAKGVTDPLFKLLPGFGGNQIKKSIDGVKSIIKGGSYAGDKLKAPIDIDPLKAAQAMMFGPNATKEMQTYFKEDRRPLSEKQTQQIDSLSDEDKKNAYEALMKQRKIESLRAAYKKTTENQDSTVSQKQKKVEDLIRTYNELVQAK